MKIMKLLASCAMVGALTAVCASGAFADKPIPVVDYVTEGEGAPYIEVAVPTEYVATGDYTVLVLNADVDDESRKGEDENGVAYNNVGKVTNADITQIDQWDGKTAIKLAVNTLADGTYYVRVGGAAPTTDNANGYIDTTFTVGSTEKPKVLIGSADGDTSVTANDCTEIFKYINGKIGTIRTDAETVNNVNFAAGAYCDGDNVITANDCTEIFKYINGKNPTYVGTTVDLGKYDVAD